MINDSGYIIKNVMDYTTNVQRIIKKVYIGSQLVFNSPLGALADRASFLNNNTKNIIDRGEKLLLTPTAYSNGALHSALPKNGSSDFTVLRNSIATYLDVNGILKVAQTNIPRIDWSTGEGVLLVENEATNIITHSEDIVGLNIKSGISEDASQFGIGFTKSVRFNNSLSTIYGYSSVNFELNKYYTYSVFILTDSEAKPIASNLSTDSNANFLLNIGGSVSSEVDYFNIPNTNIWRVSRTIIFTSSPNNNFLGISKYKEQTKPFRMIGWQLEQSSKITSYIPTNASSITRLADNISVTPPQTTSEIKEYQADGLINTISAIPTYYRIPEGEYKKITMY